MVIDTSALLAILGNKPEAVQRQHILPALILAHQQEHDPIVRSRILEAMQRIACE